MASRAPIPEVSDLLSAFGAEVRGNRRFTADVRSGSGFDVHAGVGAIIAHRLAIRDKDLFRSLYFDSSKGDEVDELIESRFGIPRVQDTAGVGTALLRRPTAASSGTVWKGTRFSAVLAGSTQQRFYEVSRDTPCSGTTLELPVPIAATEPGIGRIVSTGSTESVLNIEDLLWDPTWTLVGLDCGLGTTKERDDVYKGRTKDTRLRRRTGYIKSLTDACLAAGATHVALFSSDWQGADYGINRCYVGDSAYETTDKLRNDCMLALESARVLGADLFVFGMTKRQRTLPVTLTLWVPPDARALSFIVDQAKAAVVEYFAHGDNAFFWTESGVRTAILRAVRTDVQAVSFGLTPPDITTVFDSARIDATGKHGLTRYIVTHDTVVVSVVGPS